TESEKDLYKQNLVINNRLSDSANIYVTSGKKFFFEYKKVLPMVSEALPVFEKNGTDPWYAQTILLIESPGKTEARSYVGARGPFQLMPYVARKYGLVVTKYRDDRTSLTKSALAAAKLISNICIPYAKKILDEKSISYDEKDLWFRLFVMHIYHAGAGNVAAVIDKINPSEGGMPLIRKMWQNEARGFKNESQNYSQIALASIINFDRLISQDNDTVYLIAGDKNMKFFHDKSKICVDTLAFFNECLSAYESDLVEGSIPFDYFASRVAKVRLEMEKYSKNHGETKFSMAIKESERLHNLGNELMYKRRFNEAILVFQLGLEKNPISPATYDSLGKAYKSIGNNDLALKYSRKSKEVVENPDAFLR
ncbi:MAG TPA: transglycosylase SLT domain-containing protein, partial [Bacteroidia bacterium]|nr:transglycosylase SLT domain-containing protein [Bacteroidia bacterium]